MARTKKIVGWRFGGKPERDGQHCTFTRAFALFDDETERRFEVNDIVLVRLDDDDDDDSQDSEESGGDVPAPQVKDATVIDVDAMAKDEDAVAPDDDARAASDVKKEEEDADVDTKKKVEESEVDVDAKEENEDEADGDQPWVAQIVKFYFDPTKRTDEERKRVELRWMYYSEHMEDDTKVQRRAQMPAPSTDEGIKEVAYSEHCDYKENATNVIVGKAFLHHTPEKAEEALVEGVDDFCPGDQHMVCRTFYLYLTGKLSKGPTLRRLYTGELGYLLKNADAHDMWDRFLNAGAARSRYERAEQGKAPLHDPPPDARIAKKRRVERGNAAREVRKVDADKEAPVDHNAVKPISLTDVIQNRDLKWYDMPPGADLE